MPAGPTIQTIFGDALEIPNAQAREKFLDQVCAGDAALREELDALIKAETAAASSCFMAHPVAACEAVNEKVREFERGQTAAPPPPLLPVHPVKNFLIVHRVSLLTSAALLALTIAGTSLILRSRKADDKARAALSKEHETQAAAALRRNQTEIARPILQKLVNDLNLHSEKTSPATEANVYAVLREFAFRTRDAVPRPAEILSALEQAVQNLQKALGDDHSETLAAKSILAAAYFNARQPKKALLLLEQTLEKQKALPGTANDAALFSALELAYMYAESGQHDKAIPLDEHVIQKNTSDELLIQANFDLAAAWLISGYPEKAIQPAERAITISKKVFGPDSPAIAPEIALLARACLQSGQPERALAMCVEAVEKYHLLFGDENFATLTITSQLGFIYAQSQQLEKAIPLLEQTMALQQKLLGAEHSATLTTMRNLAFAYAADKRFDDAERLLNQALELHRKQFGEQHYNTLVVVDMLITLYINTRRFEHVIPLAEAAIEKSKLTYGEFHAETLKIRNKLADAKALAGQIEKAISLYEILVQDSKLHLGG